MGLLIFAIIVIVVAFLLIYAVDMVPITPPFNNSLRVLIIVIAALIIASRAGLI